MCKLRVQYRPVLSIFKVAEKAENQILELVGDNGPTTLGSRFRISETLRIFEESQDWRIGLRVPESPWYRH